jgi:hypothetical protein
VELTQPIYHVEPTVDVAPAGVVAAAVTNDGQTYHEDPEQRFCLCRQRAEPDRDWIMCDGCTEWYHLECVGLAGPEEADALPSWLCPSCRGAPGGDPAPPRGAEGLGPWLFRQLLGPHQGQNPLAALDEEGHAPSLALVEALYGRWAAAPRPSVRFLHHTGLGRPSFRGRVVGGDFPPDCVERAMD